MAGSVRWFNLIHLLSVVFGDADIDTRYGTDPELTEGYVKDLWDDKW